MSLLRSRPELFDFPCPVCGNLGYNACADPERAWVFDERLFGTLLLRCYGCGTVSRLEYSASFDSLSLTDVGVEAPEGGSKAKRMEAGA